MMDQAPVSKAASEMTEEPAGEHSRLTHRREKLVGTETKEILVWAGGV